MRKNILSCLCGCLLGMSSLGLQAADASYSVWDGSTQAITPTGHVYTVGSAAALAWIAGQNSDFLGDTIVLEANIDLQGKKWTPIGTSAMPFVGVFLGNGHLVKGFRSFVGHDGVGLFGHVGPEGAIQGVGISGGVLIAKNKRRIGAIAGVCAGTISECWSMAEIAAADNVVGGLVGELTATGVLQDAYQTGLIYNAGDTIGGLVGKNAGTLTRVYNAGYAKNGMAIAGLDINGTYTECYYDRKLYYQQSGVAGKQVKPVDTTADMFPLFATQAAWTNTTDKYPSLVLFDGTDASLLSVAPVFLDATSKTPVNHANDLTENFTVSTEGGITWACQDERSKTWIDINGSSVTVIRPCTETDVLVDATLGEEKRVVYFRPRRVEDLHPGKFDGEQTYCFNSEAYFAEDATMTLASEGWTANPYYYQVVRFIVTPTDTVPMDTLLFETEESNYTAWYESAAVPTDSAGRFIVRSYVHDVGCVQDWKENKHGFHYTVAETFVPGEIESGADTLFLTTKPIYVDVASKTLSKGGRGTISYWWNVSFNNEDSTIISEATLPDLTHYPISTKGQYRFTRGTKDSVCYNKTDHLEELGYYTFYVFDAFDPGEINSTGEVIFCTVADAQAYTVSTTAASGGIEGAGYHYQWYSVAGTDTTAVSGAEAQNLDLSQLPLEEGETYTFVRKAKDNYATSTFVLSRNILTFTIVHPFVPGEIQSGVDTLFLTTNPLYVGVQSKTPSQGGVGTISYWWNVSVNSQNAMMIDGATTADLTDYPISEKGQYRFTRGTKDSLCYDENQDWAELGSFIYYIFDAFDPGEINSTEELIFCTVADAQAYTVSTTAAAGGVEGDGYHYQWYSVSGTDTTAISGAEDQNLDLSQLTLEEGETYTFVRKAKDNYATSTFVLSRNILTFTIAHPFISGEIQSGVDTLFLTTNPLYVGVQSKTLSQGGVGTISYWWNVSVNSKSATTIDGATTANLTDYPITSKGKYRFTRGTKDSLCYDEHQNWAELGSFTYYIFDAFDPGTIREDDTDMSFCTVEDAQSVTIHGTAAGGGVESAGYSYQWYTVSGKDTTAIDGAVERNLKLKDAPLQAGRTHVFVRKARCNTSQSTWTRSANAATVYIYQELNPGAIPSMALDNYCASFNASGSETVSVTIPSQSAASGENGIEYHWYRVLGSDTIEVGTTASLSYTFPLYTIEEGQTYTYIRTANNPGCAPKQSEGAVTQYYGRDTRAEQTVTICASELPYTMEWYDSDSVRHTHTFASINDTWIVSDKSTLCNHDTVFRLATLPVPSFTMDSVASLCQNTSVLTLFVKQIEGVSNVFRIQYSPELAKYMGSTDTVGVIPASGVIEFYNIPAIGVGDCYMLVSAGYSESDLENVCFSVNTQKVIINASLGGYVYNKFNRVLFVDNNPKNGALGDLVDKLEFTAYQWYKNRELQEGKTEQYYHEDGQELNGVYYVMMTATNGMKYRSCEVTMPEATATASAPQTTVIYPVPVEAGAPLTIEGTGSVAIHALSGSPVASVPYFEGKAVVEAPHTAGIYYVQISQPDGSTEMHKLIVK